MSSMYPRLKIEALVWQLLLNQQMADTVCVSVLLCFYVFLLNIYLCLSLLPVEPGIQEST